MNKNMDRNLKATILICGGALIAVTVIFYLLAFDNIFTIPMCWLSLMFILLTEIIGIVKAIYIDKTIFGIANIFTSIVHFGIVFVISMVFVNILLFKITTYVLLNILALCVLLVIDTVIIFFNGSISNKNQKLSESKGVMDSCYNKAKEISIEYDSSAYKNDLNEIAEMIKYSDNSSLTDDEIKILNKLDELQLLLSNGNEGVSDKITELKNIIKLRSVKMSIQKRGGY